MFLHSLYAVSAWKAAHLSPSDRLDPDRQSSLLYHLISSFFANGYGGSHMRDYAMGVPPGLFTHHSVAKGWLAAFVAVHFTPGDLIYAKVTGPGPVRALVHAYESIDTTTGILNSYNKVRPATLRGEVRPCSKPSWVTYVMLRGGGATASMHEGPVFGTSDGSVLEASPHRSRCHTNALPRCLGAPSPPMLFARYDSSPGLMTDVSPPTNNT